MEMYIWNTIIVLSKILFYAGFASIAGYLFIGHTLVGHKRQSKRVCNKPHERTKWVNVSLCTALIASVVWFLASTGAIAEEGFSGIFDPDMLDIMWDSSVGDATLLRAAGLSLALFAIALPVKVRAMHNIKQGILAVSLLTLAYSFTLLGHVTELGGLEKVLLVIHVFVVAWWFGALYPLKQACHLLDDEELYLLMETFGKHATIMVISLLLAGLFLAIQLIGSIETLLSSSYGKVLLAKLLLVTCILGIAAKHKLKLVPSVKRDGGRELLTKSITVEIVVAIAILSVTAVLTSIVGPDG